VTSRLAPAKDRKLNKTLKTKEWCAVEVTNLQKSSESLGNADSPSQIASQNSGEALHGLDSVVESWPKLPTALKAAILAIVNSSEGVR
jgi:uncharacterized protein (DUF2235 family)